MNTGPDPNKLIVVYDSTGSYLVNVTETEQWTLEDELADWSFDMYPNTIRRRSLYRFICDRSWMLIEQVEFPLVGMIEKPTYKLLSDSEAAQQLILSRHVPPDDILHHVADRIWPPVSGSAAPSAPLMLPAPAVNDEATRAEVPPSSATRAQSSEQTDRLPPFASRSDLAKYVRQHRPDVSTAAVDSFLRRVQKKNPECATPVEEPRRNEPHNMLRTAEVLPILKKKYHF